MYLCTDHFFSAPGLLIGALLKGSIRQRFQMDLNEWAMNEDGLIRLWPSSQKLR
jgi:hypothetical protein